MKSLKPKKQTAKPASKKLLILLFFWVLQRLLSQRIHSLLRHRSRKPQEFSPMQLLKVKLIRSSALKKTLLSASFCPLELALTATTELKSKRLKKKTLMQSQNKKSRKFATHLILNKLITLGCWPRALFVFKVLLLFFY